MSELKIKREPCQVEGCKQNAKFALFKTYPNGHKEWLHVCVEHEKRIGWENMKRYRNSKQGRKINNGMSVR